MARLVPDSNTVNVGTSDVVVYNEVEGNEVIEIVFTNTSATQIISLSDGQPAVSLSGIVLYPGWAHFETVDANYQPSALEWHAIANASGGTLAIRRRLKFG
jgi:hypothetical protein